MVLSLYQSLKIVKFQNPFSFFFLLRDSGLRVCGEKTKNKHRKISGIFFTSLPRNSPSRNVHHSSASSIKVGGGVQLFPTFMRMDKVPGKLFPLFFMLSSDSDGTIDIPGFPGSFGQVRQENRQLRGDSSPGCSRLPEDEPPASGGVLASQG
jgi:hypothetical protein